MRTALDRRIDHLRARTPAGCPACRALPPLGVLWPEDAAPLASCPSCERATTGTVWVRFVQVDRGPA